MLLTIFWVILYAEFNIAIVVSGIFFSFLVASLVTYTFHNIPMGQRAIFKNIITFIRFFIKLMGEILKSNIMMAGWILRPSLPINPRVIALKPGLHSDIAKVILANSITMTPSSLVIDVNDEGTFFVHCLTEKAEAHVWRIEKMVRGLFKEG